MIYRHWTLAPWDAERWPNFSRIEFACKHCGEFYYDEDYFDSLQAARTLVGRPFNNNSGHRCWRHNMAVGGSPASQHKKIATDISLKGHDKRKLISAVKLFGFTGTGYYNTFLHIDKGRKRFWYGAGARETWSK